MSLLQNSNAISSGGYNITDSLRFRSSANAYLSRTPTSAGNRKTWTWSAWIKRGNVSSAQFIFEAGTTANETNRIYIDSSGRLNFQTIVSGIEISSLITTALYRDPSAWYHLIFAVDTTQATASNRIKIYVNGTQVTTFNTATYQNQNTDTYINSTIAHAIGRRAIDTTLPFDGYMTEVNFVDGQALDPSYFGSTNADGVWSPIKYTGSYGTNGFYLPMKETTQATGFNTVLYTGTGATQSISNVGFSPDLVWLKSRSLNAIHAVFDTVRGAPLRLRTNDTVAEDSSTALTSFTSNGFTLGADYSANNSGSTFVAWCWDAGSSTVSNTDGTITSSVRANPATGFSIVTYTDSSSGGSIGHGLSQAPEVIISKLRNTTSEWVVLTTAIDGSVDYLLLNQTSAAANAGQTITSTTFDSPYFTNNTAVSYCFHSVSGYSKFGSYTGNGSSTGPTVTTGFRPAFVMIKSTTTAGSNWWLADNTRDVANPNNALLFPNLSNAEYTTAGVEIDFNDTGFQLKTSSPDGNKSGDTFIYMAFADTRDNQWNFDASGNKNNWTPNNINSNASSETTYDLMSDTPSLADEDTSNFATLNPISNPNGTIVTFSNGNLNFSHSASSGNAPKMVVMSTIAFPSGKWYWEYTVGATVNDNVGISTELVAGGTAFGSGYASYINSGSFTGTYTNPSAGASFTTGDVIGMAYDQSAGTLAFYKNNTLQGTATNISTTATHFAFRTPNSSSTGGSGTFNFGQRPFKYTPPTGYKKLNTFNLPDSSITDGSDYFAPVTYTGNGGTQNITMDFGPDLVWIKCRSITAGAITGHSLLDSIRGASNELSSNTTNAENTLDNSLYGDMTAFNSDGFTVTDGTDINYDTYNGSGDSYISWNWRGSDSTAVSNTDGTITSTVSANPTSGFSVVTYTGTGANATVGHGLGSAPKMIIVKWRSGGGLTAQDWDVYHSNLTSAAYRLLLNTTAAQASAPQAWNSTAPTSTVFSVGTGTDVNGSGAAYVAYCFAEIAGFSKFSSYTGNGSTDGPMVYCGFKPAFILLKNSNTTNGWGMFDVKRDTYNIVNQYLEPNASSAEATYANWQFDFLSNGFKVRSSTAEANGSGNTIIFMAFASNPFKNSLGQ